MNLILGVHHRAIKRSTLVLQVLHIQLLDEHPSRRYGHLGLHGHAHDSINATKRIAQLSWLAFDLLQTF